MQLWESMYATVFQECGYDAVSRPLNQVINQDGNQANNQEAIFHPPKKQKISRKKWYSREKICEIIII